MAVYWHCRNGYWLVTFEESRPVDSVKHKHIIYSVGYNFKPLGDEDQNGLTVTGSQTHSNVRHTVL